MTAVLSLEPAGAPLSMTTREIASLTGKEHKHVLRDAEAMLATLGVDVAGYAQNWTHPQNGQSYRELALPKDLTLTLVSGYSVEMRHRIVTRWMELEGGPPSLNLRQPAQLLAVAAQLAEIVQEQQAQLTAQAPKVAFAEAVGIAENDQSVAEVAKALGTGERRLFAFLRDNAVLMVNNLPFQHHLDAKRFRVVEKTWKDADGVTRMRTQTRVTGKGVTFIQQLLARAASMEPH